MGYYLALGKTPDTSITLSPDELSQFIDKQKWSFIIEEHSNCPPTFGFRYSHEKSSCVGSMDIVNNPTSDGSMQAPWISVRLSWASDEYFPAAIRFLMGICDELEMVLSCDGTVITGDNLNIFVSGFFKSAGKVVEAFGRISQTKTNDVSQ